MRLVGNLPLVVHDPNAHAMAAGPVANDLDDRIEIFLARALLGEHLQQGAGEAIAPLGLFPQGDVGGHGINAVAMVVRHGLPRQPAIGTILTTVAVLEFDRRNTLRQVTQHVLRLFPVIGIDRLDERAGEQFQYRVAQHLLECRVDPLEISVAAGDAKHLGHELEQGLQFGRSRGFFQPTPDRGRLDTVATGTRRPQEPSHRNRTDKRLGQRRLDAIHASTCLRSLTTDPRYARRVDTFFSAFSVGNPTTGAQGLPPRLIAA